MCWKCRSLLAAGFTTTASAALERPPPPPPVSLRCSFVPEEEDDVQSGGEENASSSHCLFDPPPDTRRGRRGKRRVVLGGGIAGAKCAEELLRFRVDAKREGDEKDDEDAVILVEKSDVLKIGHWRDEKDIWRGKMDVETMAIDDAVETGGLKIVRGEAVKVDGDAQTVTVRLNKKKKNSRGDDDDNDDDLLRVIEFDQICFAVGARPKRLSSSAATAGASETNENDTVVKYVRDTQSAKILSEALREAFERSSYAGERDRDGKAICERKRSEKKWTIVVSGNGAVALEIVNALDESVLNMIMSFVKSELASSSSSRVADACKNQRRKRRRKRTSDVTEDAKMYRKKKMMVEALKRMHAVWVVKHEAIGDALFDRDASAFLLEHRRARREAARRKILGEIEARERIDNNNNNNNDNDVGEEQTNNNNNNKKKNSATKKFTFDEKISYPRRRGAFGANLCAKTSSAGPDWFKRINAALLFDNVLDEKEEAIKGEDVEVIEVDNDDDDDDDDDDRDNIEEKENLDRRAYLTSLVNALFATDWLSIETNCEIKDVVPCVEDKSKTATVHLTNNKSLSDVLVVAACIGVEPNGSDLFGDEATAHEKFGFVKSHDTVVTSSSSKENDEDDSSSGMFITDGILVTETFELALPNKPNVFFAAGDCTLCERRNEDKSTNWFQMRSWSQAAQSGAQCARSMLKIDGYEYGLGFNFELFTHSTTFFGLKVVLLGSFNMQKFLPEANEEDVRILSRKFVDDGSSRDGNNDDEEGEDVSSSLCSKSTFIRVVTYKGKVVGAVLVGETNLEETFENLIQDKIDVSHLESDLLDPDVDIEDYFD